VSDDFLTYGIGSASIHPYPWNLTDDEVERELAAPDISKPEERG
jgi:hypothetical protein